MKKVVSVLMTVAMLAALMVPSFAVLNGSNDPDEGDTIVKTSTTMEGGQDARRYTVTIPADTTIVWGAEKTDLTGYTAEAHLAYGEKLSVTVAGSGKMTYSPEAGVTLELPYTLEGDTAYKSTGAVVYPVANLALSVNIAADDWNQAVVGEYQDTLTFTAAIVTE